MMIASNKWTLPPWISKPRFEYVCLFIDLYKDLYVYIWEYKNWRFLRQKFINIKPFPPLNIQNLKKVKTKQILCNPYLLSLYQSYIKVIDSILETYLIITANPKSCYNCFLCFDEWISMLLMFSVLNEFMVIGLKKCIGNNY